MNPADLQSHSTLIQQAKLPLIILPANASFDQQLAAASLNLALTQAQKKPTLCGVKKVANPTIPGLDSLTTKLGSSHLLVSFDYSPEVVDKVSYHLDEEQKKFYLTVKPQKGEKPLDKNKVEYEYVGADADLIILFGVNQLDELEQLYLGYEDLYNSANLLCITAGTPSFQCNHIDSSQISSASEVVYHLLSLVEVEMDSDSATNLLAGIQYQTNNFTNYMADANTFEAVAGLLRLGARRKAGGFEKAAEVQSEVEPAAESTQLFEGGEQAEKVSEQQTQEPSLVQNQKQNLLKKIDQAKSDKAGLLRPSGLRR